MVTSFSRLGHFNTETGKQLLVWNCVRSRSVSAKVSIHGRLHGIAGDDGKWSIERIRLRLLQ